MVAAVPALLDTLDDDGVVAGHDAHLLLLQPKPKESALRSFCRCA
jgi:hypothetical protein